MSGRVRVTLSDGRRVTGYRKTLTERAPRTPAHMMPDWRLSFILPGTLGLGLASYPGIIGVEAWPTGWVEVSGKNREWVMRQAVLFLRQVAPQGIASPLNARLQRDAEQGPTQSGPMHAREDRGITIDFNGRSATQITGHAMRPILIP
jgi:hypothetical protein